MNVRLAKAIQKQLTDTEILMYKILFIYTTVETETGEIKKSARRPSLWPVVPQVGTEVHFSDDAHGIVKQVSHCTDYGMIIVWLEPEFEDDGSEAIEDLIQNRGWRSDNKDWSDYKDSDWLQLKNPRF